MPNELVKVWLVYFVSTGAIRSVWYTDPRKEIPGFMNKIGQGNALLEAQVTPAQLKILSELKVVNGRLVHALAHVRVG